MRFKNNFYSTSNNLSRHFYLSLLITLRIINFSPNYVSQNKVVDNNPDFFCQLEEVVQTFDYDSSGDIDSKLELNAFSKYLELKYPLKNNDAKKFQYLLSAREKMFD